MARCNQLRRLLEHVKGNCLIKRMDWPTKGEAQLDLLFNSREDVVGNMIISVSLGCSNHELVEVKILKEVRKVSSRLQLIQNTGKWDPMKGSSEGQRR